MPERDRTEIDAAFLLEHVDEAHRALIEQVVDVDEAFLDRYLRA